MLKKFFRITRVEVSGAERLYPRGIAWNVQPGMNVVVGGTGLGKSTLVNAMLFGLFGPLGQSSKRRVAKVDSDYFKGRFGPQSADGEQPYVTVEAQFGETNARVQRNLATGRVISFELDSQPRKDDVLHALSVALDMESTDELAKLVDHLVYASEQRYFIAWDNQSQNEVLSILFASSKDFERLAAIWEDAQSADSQMRNLRYQAYRIEQELKAARGAGGEEPLPGEEVLKTRRVELRTAAETAQRTVDDIVKRLGEEESAVAGFAGKVSDLQIKYTRVASEIEEQDVGPDTLLLESITAEPSAQSVFWSLRGLATDPAGKTCPSCMTHLESPNAHLNRLKALLDSGACPICASSIHVRRPGKKRSPKLEQLEGEMALIVEELRKVIVSQEQAQSRKRSILEELGRAETALTSARHSEWEFNLQYPLRGAETVDARFITLEQLKKEQDLAKKRCDRAMAKFDAARDEVNKVFDRFRGDVASRFATFSGLFLDEQCSIEFDAKGEHSVRRGAQLDPPHSSFFPVVGDVARYSSESLSEAQRTFIDLAFRMAVLDVWREYTKQPATLVIETPEGTVDVAYMVRVAEMLRAFAKQGHTVIVTTNLHNDEFLPELMHGSPKRDRASRIANLLELGRPHPVQKRYSKQFRKIIRKAERA